MTEILRFFRSEPLLGTVVLACLALVGGVVVSDWLEKRRLRKLLQLRDQLKRLHQDQLLHPDEPVSCSMTKPAASSRFSSTRPLSRIFRWEFALLSGVCMAFILPMTQETLSVGAKSLPQPATNATPATAIASTTRPEVHELFRQDLKVTLNLPASPLVSEEVSLRLNFPAAPLPGNADDMASGSLLPPNPDVLLEFSQLDDHEWDYRADSTKTLLKDNYPIHPNAFVSANPRRSGGFKR